MAKVAAQEAAAKRRRGLSAEARENIGMSQGLKGGFQGLHSKDSHIYIYCLYTICQTNKEEAKEHIKQDQEQVFTEDIGSWALFEQHHRTFQTWEMRGTCWPSEPHDIPQY